VRKYVNAYSTTEPLPRHYCVVRTYVNTCTMVVEITNFEENDLNPQIADASR